MHDGNELRDQVSPQSRLLHMLRIHQIGQDRKFLDCVK